MNIRQQLLKRNSRANADIVIAYVDATPNAIVELMACFLSDEVPVAQRAAQVVGDLGRSCPGLLEPWWEEMVRAAEEPVHDAICRNVARYFSELGPEWELPSPIETRLVKQCTDWTCDSSVPVAIQVFAMQFIANRAKHFPKEAKQVAAAIESRIDSGSAGFKSRGTSILKQMED